MTFDEFMQGVVDRHTTKEREALDRLRRELATLKQKETDAVAALDAARTKLSTFIADGMDGDAAEQKSGLAAAGHQLAAIRERLISIETAITAAETALEEAGLQAVANVRPIVAQELAAQIRKVDAAVADVVTLMVEVNTFARVVGRLLWHPRAESVWLQSLGRLPEQLDAARPMWGDLVRELEAMR